MANEHGLSPLGIYGGESDIQLERINVYFNEANGNESIESFLHLSMLVSSWFQGVNTYHERFSAIWNQGLSIVFGLHVMDKCFDRIILFLALLVLETIGQKAFEWSIHFLSRIHNQNLGYYGEGAETLDYILESVRRELENTDCLQGSLFKWDRGAMIEYLVRLGFQFTQGIGGGSGSGLGSLVLNRLREEYPDRRWSISSSSPTARRNWSLYFDFLGMIVSHTVFPSPQVSQSIVEPYNALLASQYHIESTDMLICFDNEALYNISTRLLKTPSPTMNDRQSSLSISTA